MNAAPTFSIVIFLAVGVVFTDCSLKIHPLYFLAFLLKHGVANSACAALEKHLILFTTPGLTVKYYDVPKLHYYCPLTFKVFLGGVV